MGGAPVTWTAIFASLVLGLIVNEVSDIAPWAARKIVIFCAGRIGEAEASQRFEAEWLAALDDRPGKLLKLCTAISILLQATVQLRALLGPGRARTGRHRKSRDASPVSPRIDELAARSKKLPSLPFRPGDIPTVSVVISCRHNERTIRATVDALFGQTYPGVHEVILVGSAHDTTWQALGGITDPRLIILEQEPTPGLRDPNTKRDKGIRHATGDVLALVDSDIVMDPDWLEKGMRLLVASGAHCVGGGMKSIYDSFWGRFVDGTRSGAKTPRVAEPYLITAENFGHYDRRPPVTANVIFTRWLYADVPLDVHWPYGYENYEWFWRVTKFGYDIHFSDEMNGAHHRRRGLRSLCREYLRSSDGCAKFVRAHPDCPLARKRFRQMVLLPLTALASATAAASVSVAAHQMLPVMEATGMLGAAAGTIAAAWNYSEQRAAAALTYPLLNVIFGSLFVVGMIKGIFMAAPSRMLARLRRPPR
jgi:GT2 family glycosyltransferase